MNPHCVCKEPGDCPRHKMRKMGRFFTFCQGTANTADCGLKYWNAWEQGQLGATVPENTVINPPNFCGSRNTLKRRSRGLGDRVAKVTQAVGIKPCGGCKGRQAKLNHYFPSDYTPVESRPFTGPIRRNLLYHIYPMKKNRGVWQWNLDQLIRRIDLFNGKRIVGIVHDRLSDPPDMVKEYLRGHVDNFVVLNNVKKRGEGITFLSMMEQIESFDKNEITFRCHAKGVSKKGTELALVKKWTEIMYAVCLDDWQHVKSQLEKCAITGPFRRNTRMGGASWFFSGAFYWFRNRDTFQRNWRYIHKQRVGIETWPCNMFQNSESGCLFDDAAGSLYQQNYMEDRAWPKYQKWLSDHIPNRVIAEGRNQHPQWMLQHRSSEKSLDELYHLVSTTPSDICEHCTTLKELASRCETVTEFGTRYGVSTIALLAGEPARMTSYDIKRSASVTMIENAVEKTDFQFVQADTLQSEIEQTDLLFIDTLHTYEQLKAELIRHASKARRYLILHDTVTFGTRGETGGKGLRPAIDEFLSDNPQWSVKADFKNCNGLLVLGVRDDS